MHSANAAQIWVEGSADDDLFDRIGAFLAANRLSAKPAHYAFAHEVLSQPGSAIALAVARLTEDGVRLTRQDIESLGRVVSTGRPTDPHATVSVAGVSLMAVVPPVLTAANDEADRLIQQTQMQVADFAAMVRAIHCDTADFGRDLAQSAHALTVIPVTDFASEIARLAAAMVSRVRAAEIRLADAIRESEDLRTRLEEAHDSARRDPMTGLPNRRAFKEAFDRFTPAGVRQMVAICDVDRFKRINDEFGHAVGDRVLNAIGRVLVEDCAGHVVSRYGGEEFAVLLTGVDPAAARATLERARTSIGNKRFRCRDTDRPIGQITLSAGLVEVQAGETMEQALERADRLLYDAKANGRNRIEVEGHLTK